MHDERSTLLVCYMEWEPFSVFLVQHFLPQILNYWCQVLIQFRVDTCGYQVCPDSMKYMLILGYFNQSTYHLLSNLAQAVILLTYIQKVLG
jgi:hypothetical protein